MSEGLVVTAEFDSLYEEKIVVSRDGENEDNYNFYTVSIGFFSYGAYNDDRLSFRDRIRYAWHILRTGNPWLDMVMMAPKVAKAFANRIIYMTEQMEKKMSMAKDRLDN